MITATLTKPTTINPIQTCETRIHLTDNIDIAAYHPPKPRVISIHPVSRRVNRKRSTVKPSTQQDKLSKEKDFAGSQENGKDSRASSDMPESSSVADSEDRTPQSPMGTEQSEESVRSGPTEKSFRLGPAPSRFAKQNSMSGSTASTTDKTITATIELLKAGCLRGDLLPLKITVDHTKPIKSMHGVIITLIRQARFDTVPVLPAHFKGKAATKAKHDQYYPKSRTGLGSLSLSSAGTSSTFRKDLAQTFAPLIVDPRTLTAVVKAQVRVPLEAFPTISTVPGGMVSFRYFVEVVVDLGGKLAGQDKFLPGLGMVNGASGYGNGAEEGGNMLAAWGGGVVETEHLRREKSVVSCRFEVIVGTTDSSRKKAERKILEHMDSYVSHGQEILPLPDTHQDMGEYDFSYNGHYGGYEDQEDDIYEGPYEYDENQGYDPYDNYNYESHIPPSVPLPEVEHEEVVDEKTKMRLAEQRLLPSAPPLDASAGSSAAAPLAPTAPSIPLSGDIGEAGPSLPPHLASYTHDVTQDSIPRPSAPSLSHPVDEDRETLDPPNYPRGAPLIVAGGSGHDEALAPTDDKEELRRRRLLLEASAPELPEDLDLGASMAAGPSAPSLDANEEEFSLDGSHTGGDLPRYER
jgi:arrestin-related trafficking adapter 9